MLNGKRPPKPSNPPRADVKTQRKCLADKTRHFHRHLPLHHFAFTLLSSKGLIQTLQTQICLNTAPRRCCHFGKVNLFETRRRRQVGGRCQKCWTTGKGPGWQDVAYHAGDVIGCEWSDVYEEKAVSVINDWQKRAGTKLGNLVRKSFGSSWFRSTGL